MKIGFPEYFVAGLIAIMVACQPQPPKPPQPNPTSQIALTVVDQYRNMIPELSCVLQVDTLEPQQCSYHDFRAFWTIRSDRLGWGANLSLSAPNFAPLNERVVTAPDLGERIMSPAFKPLPRLVLNGQFFSRADGQRWTAIETSDFLLYQRFLNGEDISGVVRQRADTGFNLVRVFGMYNGSLGRFLIGDYGDRYYGQLGAFANLLAGAGLYLEFTAFADATTAMPNPADQVAHWNRLTDAFKPISNVIVEVGNELDQPINRLAALPQLLRPTGVIVSHGSNGSQALPVSPYWDYLSFHTNGAPEEQRKVGHNCMELADAKPCLTNETSRAPEIGIYRAPNASQLAFDSAAGGSLLPAGACFHSVAGRSSTLFSPLELDLARAWVRGATSVPLLCQTGPYVRRDDLLKPGILRAYERRTGDPACVVLIHQ